MFNLLIMRFCRRTALFFIVLIAIYYLGTNFWHSPQNYKVLPINGPVGLLNLSEISWPDYSRPNSSQLLDPLDITTTVGQQKTLELLVEQFELMMISLHLRDQWFLNAGSLLGSLQHHDFIPWDDDADLLLHIRHRPAVQAALRRSSSIYGFYSQELRDKLYFKPVNESVSLGPTAIGSKLLPNYPWAWPFIDIAYYEEIGPNLAQEYHNPSRKFNLSDLYPLTYRPFGKHWYPAPKRPISYLKSYYRISKQTCMSHTWSHAKEKPTKRKVVDCMKLMERYPFVHRCLVSNWKGSTNPSGLCNEYLVNGKGAAVHVIQTQLEKDECESLQFTVRHKSFKCP